MYKTLKNVGAANLAFGIVIIIAGVTVGVMSIVNGKRLLKVNQTFYFKKAQDRNVDTLNSIPFMIFYITEERSWVQEKRK